MQEEWRFAVTSDECIELVEKNYNYRYCPTLPQRDVESAEQRRKQKIHETNRTEDINV
jgi:hypothetical protein